MPIDYQAIGRRIQGRRKALGKTQDRLAEALGVSVGYISQLERGATKVNLDTLAAIAGFLECEVGLFLTGSATRQADYLLEEFSAVLPQLGQEERKLLLGIALLMAKQELP